MVIRAGQPVTGSCPIPRTLSAELREVRSSGSQRAVFKGTGDRVPSSMRRSEKRPLRLLPASRRKSANRPAFGSSPPAPSQSKESMPQDCSRLAGTAFLRMKNLRANTATSDCAARGCQDDERKCLQSVVSTWLDFTATLSSGHKCDLLVRQESERFGKLLHSCN